MWSRRWTKYVAGLVMLVMVVPGAFLVAGAIERQQDDAAQAEAGREQTCSRLVDRLVAALDGFTEQFDGLTALGSGDIPPMPSMRQLRVEAAAFDDELARSECGQGEARAAIEEWRGAKGADGPLAEAVRAALAANVVDVMGGGEERVRHRVGPDGDLAAALSQLPAGATVVLPAGRFTLDRTVALVQDVTIRGAGSGRTLVTSSAGGAGLVLASQVELRIEGARLEHRGGGTASVLVLRAGSTELDDVRIAGATRSGPVGKGAEVLLGGGSGIVLAGGERLSMSDSASSGNAMGGLLVATGAPTVQSSTFRDNEVCGVCYVGESTGRLRDSVLVGNGSGVMLGERGAPVLADNRIERNQQAGLVIEGTAAPVVRGNTISGNGEIGVAVYGEASPELSANTVSGHGQTGVLVDVGADAMPQLQGNDLGGNGSAGVVFTGQSGGRASGNTCSGARFGLVLDGSATPVLGTNACAVQDQRG